MSHSPGKRKPDGKGHRGQKKSTCRNADQGEKQPALPFRKWVKKHPSATERKEEKTEQESPIRSGSSSPEGVVRSPRPAPRAAIHEQLLARGLEQMAEQAAGNIDAAIELAVQAVEDGKLDDPSVANEHAPQPAEPVPLRRQGHSDTAQDFVPVLVPAKKGSLFGRKRALCVLAVGAIATIASRGTWLSRFMCGTITGVTAAAACVAVPVSIEAVRRRLTGYGVVSMDIQMPTTWQGAVQVINSYPTCQKNTSLYESVVAEADRLAQHLAVSCGLADSIEVGRLVTGGHYEIVPSDDEDVRPANVRANKIVDDVVELAYSVLQSRHGGSDVPLLHAPEVTTIVRSSVPTVSTKDRLVQCQELAPRVTNLSLPAPAWNAAHSGSATVACVLSQNADIHRQRLAEMVDLNWSGVAAVPMLMAIASATVSPLLIVLITVPTCRCALRTLRAGLAGLCKYAWGHGSVT